MGSVAIILVRHDGPDGNAGGGEKCSDWRCNLEEDKLGLDAAREGERGGKDASNGVA